MNKKNIEGKYEKKGGEEMSNRKDRKDEPTIAPGIDDQEELDQKATQQEIERGEYTSVTTLSLDEVDPS
jgi:hypothetical protein